MATSEDIKMAVDMIRGFAPASFRLVSARPDRISIVRSRLV